MKRVMLICTSGLTSNVLLSQMRKIIFAQQIEIEVEAFSTNQVAQGIEKNKYDAILLTPQVRYFKNTLVDLLGDQTIPIDIVRMKDYGLMDAEAILDHLQALLEIS